MCFAQSAVTAGALWFPVPVQEALNHEVPGFASTLVRTGFVWSMLIIGENLPVMFLSSSTFVGLCPGTFVP